MKTAKRIEPLHLLLLVSAIAAFILSGINPLDRLAWIGQTAAAIMLLVLLVVMYPKLKFSNFAYVMACLYLVFLFYGAHHTYSHNPIFNELKDYFGWQRNYFDRVGHFAQGFFPALLFKELYLKGGYVKPGKMANFIVILSCLALSAAYELGEFATVKIMNMTPEMIMGLQGDFFDSYWDMTWALIGAVLAVLVLGKYHDKKMHFPE